jgi:hypothetical protein
MSRSRSLSTILGSSLLLLCTRCAVYASDLDASLAAPSEAPIGTGGSETGGGGALPTRSRAADSDRFYGGGGSASASAGTGDKPDGGSATGGSNTSSAGQQAVGGGGSAAGSSTTAGSGNAAGETGGTESITDYNLSQGRPTTTDSEQSHRFHFAHDGNDGDRNSRWCATNSQSNHYWEVDLGERFELSALRIIWEKNSAYLFKVESSVDRTGWALVLDKTKSNSVVADQHYRLPPGAAGRYVRITVTGGLAINVWASFYELEVFGH